MAVKAAAPRIARINHPSLDERLGGAARIMAADLAGTLVAGLAAREVARRAEKNLAKAHTRDSECYADQNEQDYEEFVKAVWSGRLEAVKGV